MSVLSRRAWIAGLLAIASVGLGCNDGVLNPTIPPITGLVGGPTATNGAGIVSMEIRADALSAEVGTQITMENLSRPAETAAVEASGQPFELLLTQGDVGDTLRVTLTHPEQGLVSREFEVPSPTIADVRNPGASEPVINAGALAQITGEGFCHVALANDVLMAPVDLPEEQLVPIQGETRPGVILFTVPAGYAPGQYTVRVAVAESEGILELYSSDPFTVELVP